MLPLHSSNRQQPTTSNMQQEQLPQRVRRRRERRELPSTQLIACQQVQKECDIEEDSSNDGTESVQEFSNFEYLDHTADIQFHSWGDSLQEAFANMIVCMFGYITELDHVDIDPSVTRIIAVTQAHDLQSLLFHFMDEFLFVFSTDGFVCKSVQFQEFDVTNFRIKAIGRGETFDEQKHPKGTEIKAITYSHMQIHQRAKGTSHEWDVFVIVDI